LESLRDYSRFPPVSPVTNAADLDPNHINSLDRHNFLVNMSAIAHSRGESVKPVVRTRDGFAPVGVRRARSRWSTELRWFIVCVVVAWIFVMVALLFSR